MLSCARLSTGTKARSRRSKSCIAMNTGFGTVFGGRLTCIRFLLSDAGGPSREAPRRRSVVRGQARRFAAGETGAGPIGRDLSVTAQGHRPAWSFTTTVSPRVSSPPPNGLGERRCSKRARELFNDQRNAGSEPRVARYRGTSDQEYRVDQLRQPVFLGL